MINGFLAFTQSYIITQGKPMNSTLLYTVYMYQQSFQFYNTGYGAAMMGNAFDYRFNYSGTLCDQEILGSMKEVCKK